MTVFQECEMSHDRIERPDSTETEPQSDEPANIVAWAGIGFGLFAAILYAVLFMMLYELPSTRNEIEDLRTNAPALTRLLVVGGSAGLLNVVSLILCLTGYLIRGRSRFEAVVGSAISALMLLAVFSVVFVSLFLSP
jgi:hypothetical protein